MSWRGETEDGAGWGGLVPSKAELREEAERARSAAVVAQLRAENDRLRRALHEIAEEWAGAECGEPVYAQEAYAINLARSMYSLAANALNGTKDTL